MTSGESLLDRMFNRPSGIPGRIGAALMVRMNDSVTADVVDFLDVEPESAILEIGFGPGIGIEHAAEVVTDGYVAGVDVSEMMVERAIRRNEAAIDAGRVDLRRASVEDLAFPDGRFDAVFSINSLHAWPEQRDGLEEIHRVLQPDGAVVILLTKHAGRPDEPLDDLLRSAGFEDVRPLSRFDGECVLGRKRTFGCSSDEGA